MEVFIFLKRCAFEEWKQQFDLHGFRRDPGVLRHLLRFHQAVELPPIPIAANFVSKSLCDLSSGRAEHGLDNIRELQGPGKSKTPFEKFRRVLIWSFGSIFSLDFTPSQARRRSGTTCIVHSNTERYRKSPCAIPHSD